MEENNDKPIIPKILSNAPEEVVKVYNEWKERYEKLHSEENKVFVAKRSEGQGDMRVYLTAPIGLVKKQISPLNKKTRDEVLRRHSVVNTEKLELGQLKKQWQNWQTKMGVVDVEPLETTIIELLGQFKSKDEVKQIIYTAYGIELTDNKLNTLKQRNLDKIDKLKNDWEGSFDEFSVTKKKGRIERLVYLLQTQTDEYKRSNTFPVVRSKEIRGILDQIRGEIEGDKISIDINGNIDINASITMNMNIQQITQRVSVNAFIVGLVAAKRGLDPTVLMNSLVNSYYKDFNGFNKATGAEEMSYPSSLINNYDWHAIEQIHKEGNNHIEEAQLIEEQPTDKEVSLKQKMLDIMSAKTSELDKTRKVIKKKQGK